MIVVKFALDGAQALSTQSHCFYPQIVGIIQRAILVMLKVN